MIANPTITPAEMIGMIPVVFRLKMLSDTPAAKTPAKSESNTVGQSYSTGMGKLKASIPVKCIDQTPIPIAMAPPVSQTDRVQPLATVIRAAISNAALAADIPMNTESATRM
jgi:hypothetical protein